MKEFFEEYGRTIVTVLIILGIILVGYVIAGNGKTSAFGRFTSNIVDTLTRQDSSLIKGSTEYLERIAVPSHNTSASQYHKGEAQMTTEESNGITCITVSGKSDGQWYTSSTASTHTLDTTPVPWGKKSVMSFDFYSDKDTSVWFDFNVRLEGDLQADEHDNNQYTSEALYMDGDKTNASGIYSPVSVNGGKWHHMTAIVENGNKSLNPNKKDFKKVFHWIYYKQDSGTTKYQIKNLKYGVAD